MKGFGFNLKMLLQLILNILFIPVNQIYFLFALLIRLRRN